jgi:hypothetical protein
MGTLFSRTATIGFVVSAGLFAASCGHSGIEGTYTSPEGALVLDLKSGGKANFSYQGDVEDCTYTTSGTQLTVVCNGDAGTTNFSIHDDGTLTGPPGSFITALKKK